MNSSRNLVEKLDFAEHPDNILWSYDHNEFSFRTSAEQTYFEYPAYACRSKPKSILEESLRAAHLISKKQKRPVVLFSGGLDSEVVVLSFHLQKIPFEVVIADYLGHNEHDIFRAKALCQKLGIPYKVIEFDILKFWENDLEAVAKTVHCTSPQIAALCWISSHIDEYVILGDGESSLRGAHRIFFETKGERWALARWMLLKEKPGCPRFFQYTRELEASLYFETLVEQFVAGAWEFFDFKNIIYLKPFIMHKYFGSDLRPKLNGFEALGVCEDYRKHLNELLSPEGSLSWTFEKARSWALQEKRPYKCLSVEESPFSSLEKAALRQNGTKSHLIWTE